MCRHTNDAAIFGHQVGAKLKRSEEHTSELQSRLHLVCRLLLEKKKNRLLANRCLRVSPPPAEDEDDAEDEPVAAARSGEGCAPEPASAFSARWSPPTSRSTARS